jgi:hypothetical protein
MVADRQQQLVDLSGAIDRIDDPGAPDMPDFPAAGSRTRPHAFAHGTSRLSRVRSSPSSPERHRSAMMAASISLASAMVGAEIVSL